ncbi:MAG: hypothetical protein AABX53_02410 [Nanoarchaeota archaeon]
MKLLFICKHNRFRSKVAEALFNKYSLGQHQAKSAGIKLDAFFPYVAASVKNVLREYGIIDVADAPALVSRNLISWAERVIVVADNVDISVFPRDKTQRWSITDCSQDDVSAIKLRVRDIDGRVRDLLKGITKRR